MYYPFLKRIIDLVVSFLGVLFLSPIILILILILTIANRGNPFFFQPRPGKKGRVFKIIKFKSMNDKRDKDGELLPYEKRVTGIGKFIRQYSLDEIPQLFNVLKGDMSLIGPRPLLVQYLPLYNDFQKQRHDVKPGITGWAQVNGRNTISWDQKFKLDVWYTKNISFLVDVKIVIRTIKKVIHKEDINSSKNLSMPTFMGNN
ncbi:sugar transferase [Aquimarina sp. U1-2]|uniref:sugar transferase n=1 Tax=Aquimarina sp. U1-2 TaxID=2823141 RepID=UPI001AEC9D7C|nr:sugar transferase [Aquimarina sp. U1-2]MBP2832005.1 sugar transferase [Aquimarina sp. U1-2]